MHEVTGGVVLTSPDDVLEAAADDLRNAQNLAALPCPDACGPDSHSYICTGRGLLVQGYLIRAKALMEGEAEAVLKLNQSLEDLLSHIQQSIREGVE